MQRGSRRRRCIADKDLYLLRRKLSGCGRHPRRSFQFRILARVGRRSRASGRRQGQKDWPIDASQNTAAIMCAPGREKAGRLKYAERSEGVFVVATNRYRGIFGNLVASIIARMTCGPQLSPSRRLGRPGEEARVGGVTAGGLPRQRDSAYDHESALVRGNGQRPGRAEILDATVADEKPATAGPRRAQTRSKRKQSPASSPPDASGDQLPRHCRVFKP